MDFCDKLGISIIVVLFTIFFVFTNFSQADFTVSDSINLSSIKNDVLKFESYLKSISSNSSYINSNVSYIYNTVMSISSSISHLSITLSSISTTNIQILQEIQEINEKIYTINNTCNLILNKIDNIDKNIENMNKYLYEAFFGTVLEQIDYQVYEGISVDMSNHKLVSNPDRQIIVFPIDSQYTYRMDAYNSSELAYWWYSRNNVPIIGDYAEIPISTIKSDIIDFSITGPYSKPYFMIETEIGGEFFVSRQSISFTDKIEGNADKNTDKIKDTMTSTDYDDSSVNIDTSAADLDDSSVTGLFETLFTNFSNKISNYGGVETIQIPVPFTDDNLELKSNILSSIIEGTFLSTFIRLLWYYLFGLYLFKFVNKLYNSIKSGNIIGGISFNDEVISSTML